MHRKQAIAFVASCIVLIAVAEEPQIMRGNYSSPLVLETASDSTLSAELSAKGIETAEALNAYDAILKQGAGVLTVDGGLIADFAGEIHILEGSWKASGNGHLGTASGKTYVHGDGADLWLLYK